MYEKELKIAIRCKETGYNNICSCRNKKVLRNSLAVVENSERINMRGMFLKECEDGLILELGLTTAKNVLEKVIIPIAQQYSIIEMEEAVKRKLYKLNNMKQTKGYRMDSDKLIKNTYVQCSKFLKNNDAKFGDVKAKTLRNELLYATGVWREKKINAYNNKLKKLSKTN